MHETFSIGCVVVVQLLPLVVSTIIRPDEFVSRISWFLRFRSFVPQIQESIPDDVVQLRWRNYVVQTPKQ